MAVIPTLGAQANPFFSNFFAGNDTPYNNSNTLLSVGLGLLSGKTPQEQVANAATNFTNERQMGRTFNKTLDLLGKENPELAQAVQGGLLSPSDAYKLHLQQKAASVKAEKPAQFQELADGTYGWADPNTMTFNTLGKASKPTGQNEISADIEARKAAAQQMGITPDNPMYQTYVLTGKAPREDQQNLTATDKKAILESDDAISTNKSAIGLLDQALSINDQANSGYGASGRSWLGNNLPDYLVPDAVSSPESSAATTEYDNLVQQGALSQLKTIFGGNPTEGERSILLDLQASSNKPPEVRKKILLRAKDLAARRLELNQTRANQLRGGDFYKSGGGMSGGGAPTGNTTSNGVTWSVK